MDNFFLPTDSIFKPAQPHVQDSTSATLVDKDGKVTHMVPSEGNMYRLPCIEDEHGQDLEVQAC